MVAKLGNVAEAFKRRLNQNQQDIKYIKDIGLFKDVEGSLSAINKNIQKQHNNETSDDDFRKAHETINTNLEIIGSMCQEDAEVVRKKIDKWADGPLKEEGIYLLDEL